MGKTACDPLLNRVKAELFRRPRATRGQKPLARTGSMWRFGIGGPMITGASYGVRRERRDALYAVVGLGVTQIIGWGSTLTALTIFGTPIEKELVLQREVVFGGIAVMLLIAAALSPGVGKLIDRHGARVIMTLGSVIVAIAMLAQAGAQGVVTYMLGWVLFGIAMPLTMNSAAIPGLVQVVGRNARSAVTGLTLLSALSATIFLPFSAYLLDSVGWRRAYLLFALLHILVCMPIHWRVQRFSTGAANAAVEGSKPTKNQQAPAELLLAPKHRNRAFWLIAVWSGTEGLLQWGLYIQVIDVLMGMGLNRDTAVWAWALVGPMRACARLIEMLTGGRHSILTTAMTSAMLMTLSFTPFLVLGVTTPSTIMFCLVMGTGHGLFAVARNLLPLHLFGAKEFGTYTGYLMVPQNVVNALAPIIFAFILARYPPVVALGLAGLSACLGGVAVLMLVRFCRTQMPQD